MIKVARIEGDFTGAREALAMYTREWDDRVPDSLDPLSAVRRYIADVEANLTFGPEVLEQPAFVAGA